MKKRGCKKSLYCHLRLKSSIGFWNLSEMRERNDAEIAKTECRLVSSDDLQQAPGVKTEYEWDRDK